MIMLQPLLVAPNHLCGFQTLARIMSENPTDATMHITRFPSNRPFRSFVGHRPPTYVFRTLPLVGGH